MIVINQSCDIYTQAERIELIYHMLLNILFGTTPDTYRQVSVQGQNVAIVIE